MLYAIYRAYTGYRSNSVFTKTDDSVRHWTVTIAHIQLLTGILLYTQSPVIKYFWKNYHEAIHQQEITFFGLVHISIMVTAIVILTVGSALAKRKDIHREKFRTMLLWFLLALIIIFIAIPWPFSPLANRVYFRPF
ncbi:hypothetical protein [Chitinophaga sp. CF118]|uniref:hypothetical protein n=1 Tax=Chitinophaga sp. CF118 TaxID=1884367 RepID=UPI002101AB8D|nr:hypothetical protein [Chitinophaga sp. CF118]